MKTEKESRNKRRAHEPETRDARLLAYFAMAGGALLAAQPADAAVVYSGIKNLAVNSGDSVSIDIDNNTTQECGIFFSTSSSTSYGYHSLYIRALSNASVLGSSGSSQLPLNVAKGATISKTLSPWAKYWGRLAGYDWRTTMYWNGTSTVTYTHTNTNGNFMGKKGYLGVRFSVDNDTHYGWIQFEGNDNATAGTVIDWAYETQDNASIKAGDNGSVPLTTTTTTPAVTTTTTPAVTTTTTPAVTTTTTPSSTTTTTPATPGKKCPISKSMGSGSGELDMLRQFRDKVMSKSEAGQEYVRLYYAHGPEISEILARDTMLKLKVAGAVLQALPVVSRTLKGDTEPVLPPRLAKTMQALAESIGGKAGPELKKDINDVLTAMQDESLLKRMAGKA